jgi:hypothetical protein
MPTLAGSGTLPEQQAQAAAIASQIFDRIAVKENSA